MAPYLVILIALAVLWLSVGSTVSGQEPRPPESESELEVQFESEEAADGSGSSPITCGAQSHITPYFGTFYNWGGVTSCNQTMTYLEVESWLDFWDEADARYHNIGHIGPKPCPSTNFCARSRLDSLSTALWKARTRHYMVAPPGYSPPTNTGWTWATRNVP
ncbi:MAG: hypothetical protein ACE5JL_19825 [Dehalococcoidia bacterium]